MRSPPPAAPIAASRWCRSTVGDAELKRLAAAGLCGARFHYMKHLAKGASIDEVIAFGKRLADIGWHLQIHMEAALIAELAPALKRSPVPVVIDHMGRIDASLGLEQPEFRALLALMQDKNVWVKVSGADRITRQGPPYADAVPFARKLVAEFGDRCVWGTDWPHPNHARARFPTTACWWTSWPRSRRARPRGRRCWWTIRSGSIVSRRPRKPSPRGATA